MADQASWPCKDRMCALLQAVWPPRLSWNHGAITYAIASSCLDTSRRLSAPGDGGHSRRRLHPGVPEATAGPCAVRPLVPNSTVCQGRAGTQRTDNQCPYHRPSHLGDSPSPLRGGGGGRFLPTSRPQTHSRKGQPFWCPSCSGGARSTQTECWRWFPPRLRCGTRAPRGLEGAHASGGSLGRSLVVQPE
jgi:hypothetical protein